MKINILYEDKDVVVIDKPAGMSVHKDGKNEEYTVADWMLENYPKSKKVGEPLMIDRTGGDREAIARPGIVHRLDKETSGVMILAKSQKAFQFLKDQFQEHSIQKVYRAFVYGYVADPKASLKTGMRGIINASIGRSPKDVRMWTAGRGAREPLRDAVTEYNVLARFTDTEDEKEMKKNEHQFSYVEAYPKTGRTHQIRVHMRYINHPIISDPIYRGVKEKALDFKRLALHAYTISFILPFGMPIKIEAPLPADFKKVEKKFIPKNS